MSEVATDEVRHNLIGDALRRRLWIPVLFALVAALGAWYLADSRSSTYTSSVQVLVRPLVGNPLAPDTGFSSQQVTSAMATEAQVVNSQDVADLANPTLPQPWTPGSGTVKAAVPPNTQIVAITFTADNADAARTGAQTTAEAYLQQRANVAKQAQSERLKILKKQAASTQASLDRAVKASSSPTAGPQAAQQVQLLANQAVTIQDTITTLQATGGNPGAVVAPATLPKSSNQLSSVLIALVAGLLGLLLGAALAIWLERRDTRVRGTDRAVAGVPVITAMTARRRRFLPAGRRARVDSARQFVERLRTVTLVAAPPPNMVAISAVRSERSAAPVAVELAVALADAGYRVSLVNASDSDRFPIDLDDQADAGLAAALRTQASVHDYLVDVDGVRVLPAGRGLSAATPLLSSPRFGELLDELRADSDYVMLAAPPATTAVGTAVAVAASSLILVGTDRATTREEVEAARVGVDRLNVRVLGIALVARGVATRTAQRRPDPSPAVPRANHDLSSTPPPEKPVKKTAKKTGTPTGTRVP